MKTAFTGYLHPTAEEFKALFEKCFFSFDANALLDLYRYSPDTSNEFLRILSDANIKDRIWIPYQVGHEFFDNRLQVIFDQRKLYEAMKQDLAKPLDNFKSIGQHPFIDDERLEKLRSLVSDITTELDKRKEQLTLRDNDPTLQRVGTTSAYGINDAGRIVGYYTDAAYKHHGFLLDRGSYTTLDGPTVAHTIANGINASGQIVGSYVDTGGTHGFLLDQGSYTTLDGTTSAYGINDTGQIVGYYTDAAYKHHGFLVDQGSYTTLDGPTVAHTIANGINSVLLRLTR